MIRQIQTASHPGKQMYEGENASMTVSDSSVFLTYRCKVAS